MISGYRPPSEATFMTQQVWDQCEDAGLMLNALAYTGEWRKVVNIAHDVAMMVRDMVPPDWEDIVTTLMELALTSTNEKELWDAWRAINKLDLPATGHFAVLAAERLVYTAACALSILHNPWVGCSWVMRSAHKADDSLRFPDIVRKYYPEVPEIYKEEE